MSNEFDLDAAVKAGILGEDQALALRNLGARSAGASQATREGFQVFSGLADVMTALGIFALSVPAVGAIGTFPPAALVVVGALLWAGRRFTVDRSYTATAFLLFIYYAIALSTLGMMTGFGFSANAVAGLGKEALEEPTALWIVGVVTTAGCWFWWRWCRLPVAVAAAWLAAMNLVTNLIRIIVPTAPDVVASIAVLVWGLVMLAGALWWDFSDIRRETIRSRVAFWLHAAAGFLIARSVLALLSGRADSASGWTGIYFAKANDVGADVALPFLLFFASCLLFALVIDRRSLIFATLWQASIAIIALTQNFALGFAVIGILLLGMALRWQQLRRALLCRLPAAIRAQVPRTDVEGEGRRPTRRHQEMNPRRSPGRRAA